MEPQLFEVAKKVANELTNTKIREPLRTEIVELSAQKIYPLIEKVKVEAIQETARQYNTNPKWGEVIT
jgi:hypothetical protein